MTPERIKETARRILNALDEKYGWELDIESVDAYAEVVECELLAADKPVEGDLLVRIVVAAQCRGGETEVSACPTDCETSTEQAQNAAFDDGDTHRGVVDVFLPKVVSVPVVAGRVVGLGLPSDHEKADSKQ